MDETGQSPRCSLHEVMATERLARRPVRARDPIHENQALVDLVGALTSRPEELFERLATAILAYCHAQSAGVSVLESSVGEPSGSTQVMPVFRWHAVAGAFADHAGATLPRHQSPCGMAVDHAQALLFGRPQRYFTGFELAEPAVAELLTLPYYVDDEPRGTIWALTHDSQRPFDAEDLRLLEELAPFASVGQRLEADARTHEQANTILQRAYSEQRTRSARLRQYATEVTTTENRERRQLAAELQDNLQQVLVAARLQLASGRGESEPMERANELIDEAVDVSRKLVSELRPPTLYEFGLLPALRWLASELGRQGALQVHVECGEGESQTEQPTLGDDVRALLFEGVHELLTNVIAHAGTHCARVIVSATDAAASVAVEDQGRGAHIETARLEAAPGVGLFGIRERLRALGGCMHIDSAEGQGTRVELSVPLGDAHSTE